MGKDHDHGPSAGYMPGVAPVARQLFDFLHGVRGGGKKSSTRTPMEPKKAPAHHLNRWRDEGRANLVLEGIRLGVLNSSKQPVGRWAQYRTWKALAVAIERARRALDS